MTTHTFATALFAEGKTEEATVHARAAAEIRPANAGAYGEVPVGLEGKALDEAILFWSARAENEPNNIGARNTFGVLLVQKHQTRAAIEQWETALALDANDGNTQSNLVWVLATAPNASLRNGIRAVELAERALKLAGGLSPILHRTLAAAYAEAVDSTMPSQQRSAAEHWQSARATASWLTNLPPSSPNTDSTNLSATPACNCTKINYKKRVRARAGGASSASPRSTAILAVGQRASCLLIRAIRRSVKRGPGQSFHRITLQLRRAA